MVESGALPERVKKRYPPRGPLQLFRLDEPSEFTCARCGETKTSKLIAIAHQNWDRVLCNGCYGFLLSVHIIKAGDAPDSEKAADLAELLLALKPETGELSLGLVYDQDSARLERLRPLSRRFIETARFVAHKLTSATELDWSVAVLGLCKACEVELVERLIEPLRVACDGADLGPDCRDPELAPVARYCAGRSPKPPELGTIGRFLRVAATSKRRAQSSTLLSTVRELVAARKGAGWLLLDEGGPTVILALTSEYRNPATHTAAMGESDWAAAESFIMGDRGLLWKLASIDAPAAGSR